MTGADGGPLTSLITAFVLVPYADQYADVNTRDLVHPAGEGVVKAFASRCATSRATIASALVGAALGDEDPLYRLDLTAGPVADRLRENIADGEFAAPLFLGQGVEDEVIPISMQRDFSQRLCGEGRAVTTHEYPGRNHMGVVAEGSPLIDDLFAWADAVEAGEVPNTCGASAGS